MRINIFMKGGKELINQTVPPRRHSSRRQAHSTHCLVRSELQKISVAEVITHLVKGNIGPGSMSLPHAFSLVGTTAAPALIIFMGALTVYNMMLLLWCRRQIYPAEVPISFGEVAGRILGHKGQQLVDIFLIGSQLGVCCVYLSFVATNLYAVLPVELQEFLPERQLIILIYPIIVALSWIRSLHCLTPVSNLANLAVITGTCIVLYLSIQYMGHPTQKRSQQIDVNWSQIPQFYSTSVYTFEGIGLILPIHDEMKQPDRFAPILVCTMSLIALLFLILGELPALVFGNITNGSMTVVLNEYYNGWIVMLANLLLAFACLMTFPIQFYPAIKTLESRLSTRLRGQGDSVVEKRRSSGRQNQCSNTLGYSNLPRVDLGAISSPSRDIVHGNVETSSFVVSTQHPDDTVPESNADISSCQPLSSQSPNRKPLHFCDAMLSEINDTTISPLSPASRLPTPIERTLLGVSDYECNRRLFRTMLCTILMLLAVCVPDVSMLINLVGAIGSNMLAVIIPPMMFLYLPGMSISGSSKIFHWAIVLLGVFGTITGTLQALNSIYSSFF